MTDELRERIDRYREIARVYNRLMYEIKGMDAEGVVSVLTPVGGVASAMGVPLVLEHGLERRVLCETSVRAAAAAASFLRTWAGWIAQEGGDSNREATSLYEQATHPLFGMGRDQEAIRAWSAFGGAAYGLERQMNLLGDAVPAVAVLRAMADALAGLGDVE